MLRVAVVAITMWLFAGEVQYQPTPSQLPLANSKPVKPDVAWHVGQLFSTKWRLEDGTEGFLPALQLIRKRVGARDYLAAAKLMEQWAPRVKIVSEQDLEYDEGARNAWEAAEGDIYALAGRWDDATRVYERVLDRPTETPRGSFARQYAAYGLARAKSVDGDYAQAIKLLDQASSEYWSGCGNCQESEDLRNYVVRSAWNRADQGYEEARKSLSEMIEGRFPTKSGTLYVGSEKWEIKMGRAEAAVALGQVLLRNGHTSDARKVLQIALEPNESGTDAARTALGMLNALDHPQSDQSGPD